MLNDVERIEKTIMNVGRNFVLKNVVLTGNKGKDDIKLSPIYSKSYKSVKYSDHDRLTSLHIRSSDFFVFSYSDYENKRMEDVYVSYPHIDSVVGSLEKLITLVESKGTFVKDQVAPKYADLIYQTPPLGGGKTLAFFPEVIQIERNNNIEYTYGAGMLVNDDNAYVALDKSALYGLYNSLMNYDLSVNSNLILLMGMIQDSNSTSSVINNMSNNIAPTTRNGSGRHVYGSSPAGGLRKKSLRPRGMIREETEEQEAVPQKINKASSVINAEPDEEISEEEEVKEVKKPTTKKKTTRGKKSSTTNKKKSSVLSMDKINEEADEIKLPDLEDDDSLGF